MTELTAADLARSIVATHTQFTTDVRDPGTCRHDGLPFPCAARQLALLVLGRQTCAHCGQECGDPEGGLGGVPDGKGGSAPVCHPEDPRRPDCYRRVTVYLEPLGALKGPFELPQGIQQIRRTDPVPEEGR